VTTTTALCGPVPSLTATAVGSAQGTAVAAAISMARGRPNPNGGGFVEAGSSGTLCVLTKAGLVLCTGGDGHGERGAGNGVFMPGTFNVVETTTGPLDKVVSIDGGRDFFCAVRSTGDLYCWGDYEGIGHRRGGGFHSFATLTAVNATMVAAGYAYTCYVDNTGASECSGSPQNRIPLGTAPWAIPSGVKAISVNGSGGLALMTDGTVTSFGRNTRGERGDVVADLAPPGVIPNLTGVTQVSAGGGSTNNSTRHGCALLNDGTIQCWGKNRHGELGDGTTTQRAVPAQVMRNIDSGFTGATFVAAAQEHTCAISDQVYCWGRNTESQLGNPTLSDTTLPTPTVPSVTNATSLAIKGHTSCAVLTTGGIWCWGDFFGFPLAGPTPIPEFEPPST